MTGPTFSNISLMDTTNIPKISFQETKVREYLDWKLSPRPGIFNFTLPQLAEICKALKMEPEELYSIIGQYCKEQGIYLEIGGDKWL